jgi:hypothetical protein
VGRPSRDLGRRRQSLGNTAAGVHLEHDLRWHSHPGLLITTVTSGPIDLYDETCHKRTVTAGEVYTENDEAHGIINRGSVDAELYISYLVKRGLPRRQEASAPVCAPETGIP